MNPVTGSILQTSVVQKQQTEGKAQQLRRAQELRKNVAAPEDESEHQVENTEELTPIDADHSNPRNQKKGGGQQHKPEKSEEEDGESHIDMKA
jgi:hypothetical protein